MATLYSSNSEMLSEILTKPIGELFSVTLAYVDEGNRTGFERNSESRQAVSKLVGSNAFIWHPKDKEPILLNGDVVGNHIIKKAGGPCLVFSNVDDCFKNQIEDLKQYNKDKIKARLKKAEFKADSTLLMKLFAGNGKQLDLDVLLIISGMCEYLTIWRFGDLGLYCHLVSNKEVPNRLLIGAKKVLQFPEW